MTKPALSCETCGQLNSMPLGICLVSSIENQDPNTYPKGCVDCAKVSVCTVLRTLTVDGELKSAPCPECASRLDAVVYLTYSINSLTNLLSHHLLNTIKVLTIKHLDETARRQLKDALTDLKLLVDQQLLRLE